MGTRKLSRRSMIKGVAGGAVAAASIGPLIRVAPAAAQSTPVMASVDTLDSSMIPASMGQTDLQVFVPETGHSVSGTMLDYWRANGSAAVYGNPISEPFAAPNGLYSQAFERGIFQWNPNWLNTEDPTVRLMPIGTEILNDRINALNAAGRRTGADPRITAFTPPASNSARAEVVNSLNGRFSSVTGFSIAGDYQSWYDDHEGAFYLGEPISEPFEEEGKVVQYYENGMLYQTGNGAQLAKLPTLDPARWGFSTDPIDQGDLKTYDESLFQTADNPGGVDVTQLSGKRFIQVQLSTQSMAVYQGGDTVLTTLISSGLAPNLTVPGEFHVRLKYPMQTMAGFTDETGEVAGFRDPNDTSSSDTPTGDTAWTVPDVPNVMYFSLSAEALHGCYWHSNFGNPMSHGCINLPLDVAAFLYGWNPLGVHVSIIQ